MVKIFNLIHWFPSLHEDIKVLIFLFQYAVVGPDQGQVVEGMLIPWCSHCDSSSLTLAVGIVGAVIMPHNLYLHSALVKVNDISFTIFIEI
jgi:natural resistance-associated macrophage protein